MTSQNEAPVSKAAIEHLFTQARTHKFFSDKPVPETLLRDLYEIARLAPTASNTCPMRLVFVVSDEEKAKLSATLMPGNVDKVASAPVVAIIAYDMKFYEALKTLAPHIEYPSKHASMGEAQLEEFALRNSSIQAGYLILAARALGLDCGPMSGFRKPELDKAFFDGTSLRTNFIMSLGYGSGEQMKDRGARLSFDECCKVI